MIFTRKFFEILFSVALFQENRYEKKNAIDAENIEEKYKYFQLFPSNGKGDTPNIVLEQDQVDEIADFFKNLPLETIYEAINREFSLDFHSGLESLKNEVSKVYNTPETESETITSRAKSKLTIFLARLLEIFPGTKWCGQGSRAKHYDDLGVFKATDKCCRTHDLCEEHLPPGESRHNLTNTTPFTKLSCQCDISLYKCLSRVNTILSNAILYQYFNVMKKECYIVDYPPTTECKMSSAIKKKCLEYDKDTNAEKVYQWVSALKYIKEPLP